jgi:hypothetical protein
METQVESKRKLLDRQKNIEKKLRGATMSLKNKTQSVRRAMWSIFFCGVSSVLLLLGKVLSVKYPHIFITEYKGAELLLLVLFIFGLIVSVYVFVHRQRQEIAVESWLMALEAARLNVMPVARIFNETIYQWAQEYEKIEGMRVNVIKEGRSFTQGEYAEMKAWVQTTENEKIEQENTQLYEEHRRQLYTLPNDQEPLAN